MNHQIYEQQLRESATRQAMTQSTNDTYVAGKLLPKMNDWKSLKALSSSKSGISWAAPLTLAKVRPLYTSLHPPTVLYQLPKAI